MRFFAIGLLGLGVLASSCDTEDTAESGATAGVTGAGGVGAAGSTGTAGGGTGTGGTGTGGMGAGGGGGIGGGVAPGCDPLPPATGAVIEVGPAQVAELQGIVGNAVTGDTILLEDGTYDLNGAYLQFTTPGVTLRSKSGNREMVVLDGGYASAEIAAVGASDVTIADITLARAFYHPIHVSPAGDADITNTLIYNVHVIDPGQQAIKINSNGSPLRYSDNGVVACSRIELTDAGRPQVTDCYTGGIDAHRAQGWRIHDNTIEGFWCDAGLSEHGIHLWTGSRDTLIERNVLIDNARGIGLGLGDATDGRTYGDGPCVGVPNIGHYGGMIRNNAVFVGDAALFASQFGFDVGISLEQACETSVLHNTVVSTQAPYSSIEWRFGNTTATLTNNLVSHNLRERDGATGTLAGNLEDAPLTLFVDAPSGDLHLAAGAAQAIDQGTPVPAGLVDDDIDGEPRDSAPDIGADEWIPGP